MVETTQGHPPMGTVSAPTRPRPARYLLVALLVLGALVAIASNALLSSAAIDATAKSFARSPLPGTITTDLHPGTWNVWREGGGTVDAVTVVDPSGRTFEVRLGDDGSTYRYNGMESTKVASFDVPRGGQVIDARVTVSGTGEMGDTTVAVGPADEFSYVDRAKYGTIVVVLIDLVVIALIVVAPILWTRRRDGTGASR